MSVPSAEQFARTRRRSLIKILVAPLLLLVFFAAAPRIVGHKLRSQIEAQITRSTEIDFSTRQRLIAAYERVDFAQVALEPRPTDARLHAALEKGGFVTQFERLRWSLYLSILLCAVVASALAAVALLNREAGRSRDALVRNYRLSWRIAISAALANLLLLVPLLAYGLFELTTLAFGRYFPQLLGAIVLGGALALWHSIKILLKAIPLEFSEGISREVTRTEAPGLWQAVDDAARRLNTEPPAHIIVGLKPNFYVTEFTVRHEMGKVDGRTLFLCYPLLKHLSAEETLAIIGHELGHFIGEDTKLAREFFPLRFKAHATMHALARGGWAGRTSLHFLNYFVASFAVTENEASRQREFLADRKAAELTSAATAARALVRFHALIEALQLEWKDSAREALDPLNPALRAYISDQLLPNEQFWQRLFEARSPHPLDTHPSLRARLESLGQPSDVGTVKAMAVGDEESAHGRWFGGSDAVFSSLSEKAGKAAAQLKAQARVIAADMNTEEGRRVLEAEFPIQRWPINQRIGGFRPIIWVAGIMLVMAAVVILDAFRSHPGGPPLWITMAGVAVVLGLVLAVALVFRARHGRGEFVLSATEARYPGWNRPLRFADVQALSLTHGRSGPMLAFRLKARQPPYAKYAVYRLPRQTLNMPLGTLVGKQIEIAQTVHRYFTRQVASPAPPATGQTP